MSEEQIVKDIANQLTSKFRAEQAKSEAIKLLRSALKKIQTHGSPTITVWADDALRETAQYEEEL